MLAERLADGEEFYYVRARAAEALGYVALEEPDSAVSPSMLAHLRVGLSFEEPEVREKLATAIEFVALGDPGRLAHLVTDLVDHLDDGNELVRYHLCTALVAIGCEDPGALADARAELLARCDDENPSVRGRAVEALGVYARGTTRESFSASTIGSMIDDPESFVANRAAFTMEALDNDVGTDATFDSAGTVASVRTTTEEIARDIASSDTDGECPHCGLVLPETGPPMGPRCGAPN